MIISAGSHSACNTNNIRSSSNNFGSPIRNRKSNIRSTSAGNNNNENTSTRSTSGLHHGITNSNIKNRDRQDIVPALICY